MKINNIMLRTVVRVAAFIILVFSVYLFFAGHNSPGGGFIGGLMTAASLVLFYLSYDMETIKRVIPFNYEFMIATGLLLSLGTGSISLLFGDAYLTQYFDYYDLPFLGETELTTAVLFDAGIYLAVVGMALLAILSIGEER